MSCSSPDHADAPPTDQSLANSLAVFGASGSAAARSRSRSPTTDGGGVRKGAYCENLVSGAQSSARIDALADEAVYAIVDVEHVKGAQAIAHTLNIDAHPTITVLEPEAQMLLERGRTNGYHPADKLAEHLDTILNWTARRELPPEFFQTP